VITLVLGGARSGKSEVAEGIVSRSFEPGVPLVPVTYIATAADLGGDDPDFVTRIAAHRDRRPPDWRTVEVGLGGDLAGVLVTCPGPALVDSIGTWVAGHRDFAVELEPLIAALGARPAPTVLVSDEVGWGVHPETEAGRAFRDALGRVNFRLAEVAEQVVLVIAGRVLELPRALPPRPGSWG
jgi:adenosylcobinamide kinase/adenosylcobinamide-phosphate guanylyltransferase